MEIMTLVTEITASGADTRYVPVPYRGTVHSVRASCDQTMVADKTIIVSRGASAVNTATADGETAGVILDGTPDTTNKDLVFDPDSSTAANRVLKIVVLTAFTGANGTLTLRIEYDESAYIEQTASEA